MGMGDVVTDYLCDCGSQIKNWWVDGHYYYYHSGYKCPKCGRVYEPSKIESQPKIQRKPDTRFVELSEGRGGE